MPRDSFPFDPQHRDEDAPRRDRESSSVARPSRVQCRQETPAICSVDNRDSRALNPEREDSPRAHLLRDRTYLLRESELHTMSELGTFRVVAAADLGRFAYASDNARMERDVRRLRNQGLVSERTLPISGRKTLRVFALTKNGKQVRRNAKRLPDDQRIYHGIVKPREAKHDAVDSHFEKARELFDSTVTVPLSSNPADDLLRYFAVRRSWDQRQYNQITEEESRSTSTKSE